MASSEQVHYDTKLVAMATFLEESEKQLSHKYLPFCEKKIVKIGTVDPEIALLNLKKNKLRTVKYIARSAELPSGLN